ncbi:Alpha/Beta hydrolase protein [Rhodofomes roseus]|uniref:Alpha/Beta hydrolase protein n=1 Tax=Rhodofomes roseus TaxID=34475 RepID=A0ABQ8KUF3_9APHY|nr:Alpha/Beta hydrolase protein [Rhodofomes roseus]KAH9842446.1 Alpha/Beta hydrolase protein [Rhodofomes roseus]
MSKLTITYRRVGELDIKLDLSIPPSATADSAALPAVIYFHGGGLLSGSRLEEDIYFEFWLKESTLRRGLIFIAADYRLAPPSTALDIIDDVKALFSFLARPTFSKEHLPNSVSLDATRLAIAGFSGGGYVARVAGIYAEPKPKAVLSMFGMGGDFLSDHWLAVKNTYLRFPGAAQITNASVAHLLDPSIPAVAEATLRVRSDGMVSDDENRWCLFMHAWHNGNLLDFVLGQPVSATLRSLPYADRLAAIPPRLRPAILEDQINAAFPPTYLVHGVNDHCVLVSESEKTYQRLREVGVTAVLDIVPDADHGLVTSTVPPVPAPGSDEAQERGMDFIERELRK